VGALALQSTIIAPDSSERTAKEKRRVLMCTTLGANRH
jgi:hypothetical protein